MEGEDFSDTIFWFLHENSTFSGTSSSDGISLDADDYDDDNDDENEDSSSVNSDEEKRAFWDAQQHLLQDTLCRTTPTESRVRQATKEALTETAPPCHCRREAAATGGCRSCSKKQISECLRRAGFDCSIRTSKWNTSSHIPSGEHAYLEVVAERKKVKVIVELNFRAEFEMWRAGEDYNRLVSSLPEVFVGKAERLRNVVKIVCRAAKRCMKEKKVHMAPWRKLKYMQAKWLSATSTCQFDGSPPQEAVVAGSSGARPRRPGPRASLLTSALLANLPDSHCQSVAVV